MRSGLLFVSLLGTVLLIAVVLPVLGLLLFLAFIALAVVVGLLLAAPILARLPWFRDRIFVEQVGGRRVIRFGRGAFDAYRNRGRDPADPFQTQSSPLADGDVIEVEGKEID